MSKNIYLGSREYNMEKLYKIIHDWHCISGNFRLYAIGKQRTHNLFIVFFLNRRAVTIISHCIQCIPLI